MVQHCRPPIRSIDRIPVGSGRRGPITERIQRRYFEIVSGQAEDKFHWLSPVEKIAEPQPVGA